MMHVKEFKENHKNCDVRAELTPDDKNNVLITCKTHEVSIVAPIPYRQFCMHPLKCAGFHSCPRDYACSE